ncbi:MFS transporter [Actinotalea sp. M2MS4P-6]|uniref:MFS transporter n=1 Tax=Actinotalea sp. M2MS4P-6 TaxID=2983762 RepID=UPI0021E3A63A|nr:MFS transporter [Actinotalea sp. M2MS4P-6]MCV2394378.1 MFS transporter [Actinotalea sp. M2MS4P-6]
MTVLDGGASDGDPGPLRRVPDRRRWLGLVAIGVAQLMVVMNSALTSVAIPSIQADLEIADASRAWIVAGYTLVFGSFLVLGGSLTDRLGARRALMLALTGFACSAAVAGLSQAGWQFLVATSVQGLFAALLVPAGVSKLTTTFTDPAERSRALAVYGSIAASGAAVGLLLGGALTQYLSWRACFATLVPFAVLALVGSRLFLERDHVPERTRVDVVEAALLTGGVAGLGIAAALPADGRVEIRLLVGVLGAAAIGGFAWRRRTSRMPLVPRGIFGDAPSASALLAAAVSGMGMNALFLFITLFEQRGLGFSALQTGLSFLPVTLTILTLNSFVVRRLLHRVRPQALIVPGLVCTGLGAATLATLRPSTTYLPTLLLVLVLVGAGQALVGFPSLAAVLRRVPLSRSGIASSLQASAQQTGGAVGVAVLNAVAVASAVDSPDQTVVGGVGAASAVAIGIVVVALVLVAVSWIVERRRAAREPGSAERPVVSAV